MCAWSIQKGISERACKYYADILLMHIKRYPLMEAIDAVKLIHQSVAGAGHMIDDAQTSLANIKKECSSLDAACVFPPEGIEPIGNGMVRVHLGALGRIGALAEAVNRLFVYGAKLTAGDKQSFYEAIEHIRAACHDGKPLFESEALDEALRAYEAQGLVSHSEAYRAAYKPAYRVMSAWLACLAPILTRIDALIEQKGRALVAIDGNCCAGKSTLSALLETLYEDSATIPMDDFFLTADLRVNERLNEPGGNIHYERFQSEIAKRLEQGGDIRYRPFDCATMAFARQRTIKKKSLLIIEGSYSLHTLFRNYYDIKLFLEITPDAQHRRLVERESPQSLKRFIEEWVPMESRYIAAMGVKEAADFVLANEG